MVILYQKTDSGLVEVKRFHLWPNAKRWALANPDLTLYAFNGSKWYRAATFFGIPNRVWKPVKEKKR